MQNFENIGQVKQVKTTFIEGREFANEANFSFWDGQHYRILTRSKFVKVFCGPGHDFAELLTSDTEIGKMYKIMRSINQENLIIYSNHSKQTAKACDRKLMLRMIGGNEQHASRFLNKIIKLGIVAEAKICDEKRYFINPIYTMASRGISLHVYQLFREQLLPFLTKQAVRDLDRLVYRENNPTETAQGIQPNELTCNGLTYEILGEDDENRLQFMQKMASKNGGCYIGPTQGISDEVFGYVVDALLELRHSGDKQQCNKISGGHIVFPDALPVQTASICQAI